MSNFIKSSFQNLPQLFSRVRRKLSHTQVIDKRYLFKYWEQEHLKKVFNHYQVDCVFDVGANYGQYAQMIRNGAGYNGLIISFEPIPKAAAHLRALAKHDPKWVIVQQALSSSNGEQIFKIMSDSQFSSLSTPNYQDTSLFKSYNNVLEEVTVKTETLASAYSRLKEAHQFKQPFLKLDTQGYDSTILASSASMLKAFIGVQSELAIQKLYDHSIDFRDAITTYESYGFRLSAFVPNNAGHFPRLVETDCIMLREDLLT